MQRNQTSYSAASFESYTFQTLIARAQSGVTMAVTYGTFIEEEGKMRQRVKELLASGLRVIVAEKFRDKTLEEAERQGLRCIVLDEKDDLEYLHREIRKHSTRELSVSALPTLINYEKRMIAFTVPSLSKVS